MGDISAIEVPRGRIDCHPDSPVEWQKCPFGEVVDVNRLYPMERGRDYPFLEMASVKEGFGGISQYDVRAFEGSLSRFALNDTLFAKITPCAENGKVAFVDRLPADNGCGSTEFIVLSPKAEFDPFFVYSLAISPAIHSRAVSRMEGSTGRLRVTEETFKKWMWVSVPPTREEQSRIAETLKAADGHIRALDEQVRKAERVFRALLNGLSNGLRSAPKIRGRQCFTLHGNVNFDDGVVFTPEGQTAYFKVDDFNSPGNERELVNSAARIAIGRGSKAVPFEAGNVIFAKRGAALTKNRVRINAVPCFLDPNLMLMRPIPGVVEAAFLRYYLMRFRLEKLGEDAGIPQLNNKDLYPKEC